MNKIIKMRAEIIKWVTHKIEKIKKVQVALQKN